ncbi:hypothetical protein F4781DRAFT_104596 [Annulohypoxylon bovei var. microspora]|nr:hypothetical protein F4781DRAFT_104596 [Annulohypoxylon bovei var. microspora]
MTTTSEDIVVSITTPMPHRYIYVPKGSPYKTLNCRKKTREEGHPVYVVQNAKGQQMGIRVPIAIFERVQEKFEETQESRAQAVKKRDKKMETDFTKSILSQFPQIPTAEVPDIVKQAMKKHSGRVGRTGMLDIVEKVQLGVRAHIRHKYTDYEKLLNNNVSRDEARAQIHEKVDKIVLEWGGTPKASNKDGSSAQTSNHGEKSFRKPSRRRKCPGKSGRSILRAKKRARRRASASAALS